MFSFQSERCRFFPLVIFFFFILDVGLYHQFVQTMNGRFCSDKLSPWLFSNLAALTVSCIEIRKHVIHSLRLTAAIRDSDSFNTALHFNVATFLNTLWVQFKSSSKATNGDKHSLRCETASGVTFTQHLLITDERLLWANCKRILNIHNFLSFVALFRINMNRKGIM